MSYLVREAVFEDAPAIEALIASSSRALALGYYTQAQIELALTSALGLDSQLIKDRSYLVIEKEGVLAACGGWSFRKTLFGGDQEGNRDPERLDPKRHGAKIRAFFVHPSFARQGLGSLLMKECETRAREYGFTRLELMATLSGVGLYERHGFVAKPQIRYPLSDDLDIGFVPMEKDLSEENKLEDKQKMRE